MFLHWFWYLFQREKKINFTSIPLNHTVLLGEWQSLNGYYLIIQADNRASYQKIDYLSSQAKTLKWGKLHIVNDVLLINFVYSQKYFHIDKYPFQQQGQTCMLLNGVLFTKVI